MPGLHGPIYRRRPRCASRKPTLGRIFTAVLPPLIGTGFIAATPGGYVTALAQAFLNGGSGTILQRRGQGLRPLSRRDLWHRRRPEGRVPVMECGCPLATRRLGSKTLHGQLGLNVPSKPERGLTM